METEDQEELIERKKWSIWDYVPARYYLTMMLFLGLVIVFTQRVSLSIALVAMVNSTEQNQKTEGTCQQPNIEDNNTQDSNNNPNSFEEDDKFNWSPYIQGIILGSFYYGYILTPLPGGLLAEKIGGKWVFGVGVVWTSVLSLLIPVAARAHIGYFITIRILQGIGEGGTYPALFTMLVYWSTLKERSLLLAIACMGGNVAFIIANPIAAYLCEHGYAGGWPSVFYTFGITGCIWFLIWSFTVFNEPKTHPWMSKMEKLLLEKDFQSDSVKNRPPIPWIAMLKSIPMWAMFYTRFAIGYGLFTVTAELPLYFKSALNLTLSQNGLATTIIYIFQCLGMIIAGYMSDFLRQKEYFTINTIRKSCEGVALIGSALCLIAVPRVKCQSALAITILSFSMALYGFNTGGSTPGMVDMAPIFAGTITGILATFPSSAGFVGPMLTGALTEKGQTIEQWGTSFYVMAGILASGGLCFVLFGSAEVQPWAKVTPAHQTNTASFSNDENNKECNPTGLNCVIDGSQTTSN